MLFLLQGRGWVKQWLEREGYQVGFGVAQMQWWLNGNSNREGFRRSRVTDEGAVHSIDWDNSVDQPLETKVALSFLDDERNNSAPTRSGVY